MIISQKELQPLPKMLRQYLTATGVNGQSKWNTAFLKQVGLFSRDGENWKKIRAEQKIDLQKREFVWKAKLGPVQVIDQFVSGNGLLRVSLFGLFRLQEAKGLEIDEGEAQRYLTEMIWYPMAFLDRAIQWKEIEAGTLEAVLPYREAKTAKATFHFGSDGLINRISAQRYRTVGKMYSYDQWEVNHLEYKDFNGILIPYRAWVCWKLPEKDLCYYKLEITSLNFN